MNPEPKMESSQGIAERFRCFDNVFVQRSNGDRTAFNEESAHCVQLVLDDIVSYRRFAEDFGPYNLGSIYKFCDALDSALKTTNPTAQLELVIDQSRKSLANAIFLLGAFLIMLRNSTTDHACFCFRSVLPAAATYRDVTPGTQNFPLYIRNCWAGIMRARDLGWVNFLDGSFNLDDYTELDDPLNADMHVVIPGKLIAMRGPRDLGSGVDYADTIADDGQHLQRDFSPAHYAAILQQFDVSTVVRLNEACYDRRAFQDEGFAFADLFFEDRTCPPPLVAAQFLALVEAVPGAVAVHCRSGLGCTGTLIALHLIKAYGFSAREAMGWLRIVRPGSVMGPQQEFLCAREALLRRHSARSPVADTCPPQGDVAAVQARVDHTLAFYQSTLRHITCGRPQHSSSLRALPARDPPPPLGLSDPTLAMDDARLEEAVAGAGASGLDPTAAAASAGTAVALAALRLPSGGVGAAGDCSRVASSGSRGDDVGERCGRSEPAIEKPPTAVHGAAGAVGRPGST